LSRSPFLINFSSQPKRAFEPRHVPVLIELSADARKNAHGRKPNRSCSLIDAGFGRLTPATIRCTSSLASASKSAAYNSVPQPRPTDSARQYTLASTVVSYAAFGRQRLVVA
jgi:hypothetical protein